MDLSENDITEENDILAMINSAAWWTKSDCHDSFLYRFQCLILIIFNGYQFWTYKNTHTYCKKN